MVTAYDYPSAVHVDLANIDVILVGDSVGMVQLGYDTTQPVTVSELAKRVSLLDLNLSPTPHPTPPVAPRHGPRARAAPAHAHGVEAARAGTRATTGPDGRPCTPSWRAGTGA